MSRSGYSEDIDNWSLIRWRGAVTSAMRGARGQQFLRELLAALDAMPVHELIEHELEAGGQVCALGALGKARGLDMATIDPDDRETVARQFGVAKALTCEVMYENDEGRWDRETPAERWGRMHAWIASLIKDGDA